MDRNYLRIAASICLLAAGLLFALLLVSSNEAVADVDLVGKNANIKFLVDGQEDNSPTVGDTVTITIKVLNQGTDTNATNFYVRFQDGVTLINNVLVVDNVTYGGGIKNVSTTWVATGPGAHTINILIDSTSVITESSETNNTASKSLDVNIAPMVQLNANAMSQPTLANFVFNNTGSNDPDGNIVSVFWAFGDGSFAITAEATHAYKDNGSYVVSLLITDDDGGTNSTKITVTVTNRAPVARATDQTAFTYQAVWFDSGNSSDSDGSIVNVTWHIVNLDKYLYGKKVSFTFTQDSVYTVNLTVKDDDGATNAKDIYATIKNRAPTANIAANRTKINTTESITFKGNTSTDMDGSIVNYTWIFPGSQNRYGPQVSFVFNQANGSYQITLIVTDDDGAIGFKSINIKVGNKKPLVVPGLDTVADTYETITFDGSSSSDPDGSIVNYTWDMGDGSKRYNSTFDYFYANNGIYTVRLTVIDDEGASSTATIKATIMNQAPEAKHSPVTIFTYDNYWFNTSECKDKDGYIASVTWIFQDPTGTTTISGNTTYSWTENRTYAVLMTITDDDGATAETMFNVTVMNSNPWAIFAYSPTSGNSVGDLITFDASASRDQDGSITEWNWKWGDGGQSVGSGEVATHTYLYGGLFRVELVVIDNDGGSNSTFKMVLIAPKNDAPWPSFVINAPDLMTNRTITFDATGSSDLDGYITKYIWDFGDGTKLGSGKIATHKYLHPGTYTIKLTVEDNGTKQNSTSQNITLTLAPNLAPTAVINTNGVVEIVAGESMIFDGRRSSDGDGSIVNYTWDFGDGTMKYTAYASKSFGEASIGSVTVKLTVRDNLGATNSATVVIMVLAPPKKNNPPVAQFSFVPTGSVETGAQVSFDASASTDSDGSITGYTWLFGDGSFAEGKSVSHTYTNNQVFLVVLTVIDNAGGSGTISKELTVINRPPVPAIKISKDTANTFETLTFDASGSSDPDGVIKSYTWVFGENKVTKTGKIVTYAFMTPGNINVVLKTVDDDGAMGTTEKSIKINNRAPEAKTGGDLKVLEGNPINLNAEQSKDIDGTITAYHWELTGMTPSTQEGKIVTITAPTLPKGVDQQVYNVKLTVEDNNGALSNEFRFNITVMKKPVPPPDKPETGFLPGFDAVLVIATIGTVVSIIAVRKRRNQ